MFFPGDLDSARAKGVEGLLRQYDEQGFFDRVIIVSPLMRRDRRVVLDERHEIVEFGLGGSMIVRRLLAPLHFVRLILAARRIVRSEGVSVIRATEPTLCGALAWAAARLGGVPYVVSLHADYDKLFVLDRRRGAPTVFGSRVLVRLVERFTLRRAARVLPIRASLIPYVRARGVAAENVRVIPHGIDLGAFIRPPFLDVRRMLSLSADTAIIAFAGRLSPENYINDVLEAASRLATQRSDFVVVLAGGGVLETAVAARLQREPALAAVVRPIGFVAADVVRALRHAASVSLCLMGGFSLIEACAAARPVIAYDVAWHHELVIDGVTGRLLREGDIAGIVAAVSALLDNEAEAARLGAAARQLALANHDIALTSATKRRCYTEVLAG